MTTVRDIATTLPHPRRSRFLGPGGLRCRCCRPTPSRGRSGTMVARRQRRVTNEALAGVVSGLRRGSVDLD